MKGEMSGNGQLLPRQPDYKVELTFFIVLLHRIKVHIYSQTCCDVFSSRNYKIRTITFGLVFLTIKADKQFFLENVYNSWHKHFLTGSKGPKATSASVTKCNLTVTWSSFETFI